MADRPLLHQRKRTSFTAGLRLQVDERRASQRQSAEPSKKPRPEFRFLPPYSSDFNPIEMASAKLKACLKKVAAQSIYDLWNVIDTHTPQECSSYFQVAGYGCEQKIEYFVGWQRPHSRSGIECSSHVRRASRQGSDRFSGGYVSLE